MNITIAAKRKNGQWRSATIADGVFIDSNVTNDLGELFEVASIAAGIEGAVEGTLVTIIITSVTAEQQAAQKQS